MEQMEQSCAVLAQLATVQCSKCGANPGKTGWHGVCETGSVLNATVPQGTARIPTKPIEERG
jgi:hypothetical protein